MNLMDLMKNRFSARKFIVGKEVAPEMQKQILEAGLLAPTARNAQPFRFYVAGAQVSEEVIQKCTRANFHAPLNILIAVKKEEAWVRVIDGWNAAEVDSAIAATQMMYMAENLGLGSCWVCAFSPEDAKKAFGLKEDEIPISILSIGYKSEECEPGPLHSQRKNIDDVVVYVK